MRKTLPSGVFHVFSLLAQGSAAGYGSQFLLYVALETFGLRQFD